MSFTSFKAFIDLLKPYVLNFDIKTEKIEVTFSNNDDIPRIKNELLIIFSEIDIDSPVNKLTFTIDKFDFIFFWNLEHFREKLNVVEHKGGFSKDIGIFSDGECSIYFEHQNNKTLVDFVAIDNNYLFTNSEAYIQLLKFFKENEPKDDNLFFFVDYFSWDNGLIVFTTTKKEGRLLLKFPPQIPELPKDDLRIRFQRFYDAFSSQDKQRFLPKFVKAELFTSLTPFDKEKRIEVFIEKLDAIMDVAEQNFDVFLSDLSLDQFKNDFLDLQVKYFGTLRDVLGKISTQIIGLPISVSATALATYGIKELSQIPMPEVTQVVFLLAGAFSIYSLFAASLLGFYREDILDTQLQAYKGFTDLFSQPFFTEKKGDKTEFLTIKKAIEDRVFIMKIVLWAYIFLLSITNSILLFFLLTKINVSGLLAIPFGAFHLICFDPKFKWLGKRNSQTFNTP